MTHDPAKSERPTSRGDEEKRALIIRHDVPIRRRRGGCARFAVSFWRGLRCRRTSFCASSRSEITVRGGHAFAWPIVAPGYLPAALIAGDTVDDPNGSRLRLYEQGRPIGPAHAPHQEIAQAGSGRFSHWLSALFFSASDNTDPRTNGRTYRRACRSRRRRRLLRSRGAVQQAPSGRHRARPRGPPHIPTHGAPRRCEWRYRGSRRRPRLGRVPAARHLADRAERHRGPDGPFVCLGFAGVGARAFCRRPRRRCRRSRRIPVCCCSRTASGSGRRTAFTPASPTSAAAPIRTGTPMSSFRHPTAPIRARTSVSTRLAHRSVQRPGWSASPPRYCSARSPRDGVKVCASSRLTALPAGHAPPHGVARTVAGMQAAVAPRSIASNGLVRTPPHTVPRRAPRARAPRSWQPSRSSFGPRSRRRGPGGSSRKTSRPTRAVRLPGRCRRRHSRLFVAVRDDSVDAGKSSACCCSRTASRSGRRTSITP